MKGLKSLFGSFMSPRFSPLSSPPPPSEADSGLLSASSVLLFSGRGGGPSVVAAKPAASPSTSTGEQEAEEGKDLQAAAAAVEEEEEVDEEAVRDKKNWRLHVLLTSAICAVLLSYLQPNDAIELLSVHSYAWSVHGEGWRILLDFLSLRQFLDDGSYGSARSLCIASIRKLGYSCTSCYTPLDGPFGFFACTSLCNMCSEERFRGTDCVDSVIRFYLCGLESMTVKGKAFLVHPYWLSSSDESGEIVSKHGHAFRLAELIFKEKMFFASFAPSNISRPRDDKAATIRAILIAAREEALADAATQGGVTRAAEEVAGAEASEEAAAGEDAEVAKLEQLTRFSAKIAVWAPFVPPSLKEIVEEERTRFANNLFGTTLSPPPAVLGTMPLRDLVKSLHGKNTIGIKKFA